MTKESKASFADFLREYFAPDFKIVPEKTRKMTDYSFLKIDCKRNFS